ncbi:MAG: ParB/RepB/Spo0J family partition protein [Paludibacteraceae bacterium]|nr:ParB/RepB/Spo0J family partition protein [Paludibacteraceae bacterium]
MAKTNPNRGLGRGLDALIDTMNIQTGGSSSIHEVELNLIKRNPNQPRTHFDQEALDELAASIKELGVVSPVTLRKDSDGTYLIIAGERRCRAARQAGLKTIPAYVRTAADEQVMEMALIENIQREDLNAIEIALAYERLIDDYNLTQERLSERVGKKRATITNYLRLLHLPAEIQVGLTERKIDMGHARALLGSKDTAFQLRLYKQIVNDGLSVRRVEELVKQSTQVKEPSTHDSFRQLPEYKMIENRLANVFGSKVKFACSEKGKGRITIPFESVDDLQTIMSRLDTIRNS